MSSPIKHRIITRFSFLFAVMVIFFLSLFWKVITIQIFNGAEWRTLGKGNTKEDITVYATRGNIYSSDYKLLASSIPHYRLYMDFSAEALTKDILLKNIDSLSLCLSRTIGDKSPSQYRHDILSAYDQRFRGHHLRRYPISSREVSYLELLQIKQFPLFRLGSFKSGFYTEERFKRVKPYGSLASRSIGDIYGESGAGKSGIELSFNEELQGKNGICTRKKVAGKRISVNEVDPSDGSDVITTLDLDIQDVADKALRDELQRLHAEEGCAVVMEVSTGEIKAVSNLIRTEKGDYIEGRNVAFGSLTEPGSTFKIASMLIALEDGIVSPSDFIDTQNGIYSFYDTPMKDHNYKPDGTGGYGLITAAEAIQYSSNIGVSRIIDEHYKNRPSYFIDRLRSLGFNHDISFPEIPGAAQPQIKSPSDSKNWDLTSLPWMSIGYNVQIPPIYTLMLYNAIANHGRMVKPFLVKHLSRNGEITKTFHPTIISSSICSNSTLIQLQGMLLSVVEKGTAKAVRSNAFPIAGKTGTAQLGYGKERSSLRHQYSFCGYFPADNPLYTCIVVIMKPQMLVSAGGSAGKVFKQIAEHTYATKMPRRLISFSSDSTTLHAPTTKNGPSIHILHTLQNLDIPHQASTSSPWSKTSATKDGIISSPLHISDFTVPNVLGLGARDAVSLLESRGLIVHLSGIGIVRKQSIPAGTSIILGQNIKLSLQ